MFACLYVFDFPVQAALRLDPELVRERLNHVPVVMVEGPASLLRVVAINGAARNLGIEAGMTRLQAEACGSVEVRKRWIENEDTAQAALLDCAREFSPLIESTAPGTVLLDLHGTERLLGSPEHFAKAMALRAQEFGFALNLGVATDPDTATYVARGLGGITVIPDGEEAKRLAPLPSEVLFPSPEILDTLENWGVRNLGALAALPSVPLTERLGQEGLRLQRLARGETKRSLVLQEPAENFIRSFEFDDPIETLESLAFILNRLVQELCARLASWSLAASELRLKLELDSRQIQTGADQESYEHRWKPPLPTLDAKFLAHLAYLDLNVVTFFSAPIKKITVEVVPAKPRAVQSSLFSPASPESEQLAITLARIRGVVGSSDDAGISCVGSPQVLDSHRPDSFAVQPFPALARAARQHPPVAAFVLRRFRPALETSVELTGHQPHLVRLWKQHRRVLAASGPWSSSGHWWNRSLTWARDEWDVAVKMPSGTALYRIYWDRSQGRWFVEGMYD
jgi:protein ImuB